MTKLINIAVIFALISLVCMQVAQAAPVDDKNRGLLRGRKQQRRLSWDSFIKSIEKDAKTVVDDIEDITEEGYCDVIKLAAKALVSEDITTDSGCALLGTEAALECETAGGGPEDPVADLCAVAISGTGVAACESAIADGGTFDASALESDCGC
mmetsp:Transcript_15541/g.25164  ORF Transcript_15541/g.25164 Transcript_15541/m.25164 type:complete len:154 (-) Transcript_15541:24-485(-)